MFPMLTLLAGSLPAFAPAPVPKDTVTGSLGAMGAKEPTITLNSYGRQAVYKIASQAKVTINGRMGYSLDDLDDISDSHKAIVTLKIKTDVAQALDIKLQLRPGQKLWLPGRGPVTLAIRRAKEMLREQEERVRQIKQSDP